MDATRKAKSLTMMIITAIIFVIAVGVTILAAMLFVRQGDRGFLFWMTTGFIIFIEAVGFGFAMGMLSGRGTSTPIIAASWTVLVLLALVGIISITIYHYTRDPQAPADRAFAAVMAIETALAIVIVLALRGWDAHFKAAAAPITAQRQEHVQRSRSLQAVLVRLRGLTWSDQQLARQAEALLKRLDAVQASLAHSHGGGVGSREAGRTQAIDAASDAQLQSLLAELDGQVAELEEQNGDGADGKLRQILVTTNRLQGQISALQLD